MNILRSTGDTTVFTPFSILSQSWWLGWNHRIVRLKRIMEGVEAKRGPPLWPSPPYLSLVWLGAPLHSISNSPDLSLLTSGKTSLSTFHSPPMAWPLAPSSVPWPSTWPQTCLSIELPSVLHFAQPWNVFYFDSSKKLGQIKMTNCFNNLVTFLQMSLDLIFFFNYDQELFFSVFKNTLLLCFTLRSHTHLFPLRTHSLLLFQLPVNGARI